MVSPSPAMRRALVLDPDVYSGEGLRLLCEEFGYVAEVIRSSRLLPQVTGSSGLVALAIVDVRIVEDEEAIAPIAAQIDALAHPTAPIVVLGGSAQWERCFRHRKIAIVAKPVAPGRLVEIVMALQSRT